MAEIATGEKPFKRISFWAVIPLVYAVCLYILAMTAKPTAGAGIGLGLIFAMFLWAFISLPLSIVNFIAMRKFVKAGGDVRGFDLALLIVSVIPPFLIVLILAGLVSLAGMI